MDRETLKYVLRQYADRPLPPTRPREIELPLAPKKVVSLVGA